MATAPKPQRVSELIKASEDAKAAVEAAKDPDDPDELIWVNVPRAFNLNVQYVIHPIKAGEQLMARAWAQMSYSKANGVKIMGDGEG